MKKLLIVVIGVAVVLLILCINILDVSIVDNKTNNINFSNISSEELLDKSFIELQNGNNAKAYVYAKLASEKKPSDMESHLMMSTAYGNESNLKMSLKHLEIAESLIKKNTDKHDIFELYYLRAIAYHDSYIYEDIRYIN
tara:strand:+ start:304 stop:723 length:420 start_codon:yes stop_codon:yes gene_type:complete